MPPRTRATTPDERQIVLPLSPLRNRDFLSSHWIEHRLPLEPEWAAAQEAAKIALQKLLALWQVQSQRVTLYGDEAGLEEKFIQPVFECLGWHLKYQTYLDRREPDYALFLSDADLHSALSAGRTNPDFWLHAAVVADAKAWHINLDRPTRVGANREYPPEQIEWYLNHSLRDFGILTNGRLWRLVPRVLGPGKPRFQTYLEVDLPALLNGLIPKADQLALGPTGPEYEEFLRFYLLFSPAGFVSVEGRKSLIARAIDGSSEYSIGVGEELKDRVFEALRLCVEGFIRFAPNNLQPARDLRECQEHSLIFLYRLLFILYAEDRGLLPYRINQTYTNNRSLARYRDEVAGRLDQVHRGIRVTDFRDDRYDLWTDLKDLFDLIDRGNRRYGVQAYNGGLFDLEADTFLSEKVLPDWYLARVLDQLGRSVQPGKAELGLFRVDYRDLAIQQLGSVYEGLLELRPRYAEVPMRVIKSRRAGNREELVIPVSDDIPQGYEATALTYPETGIYLSTDKGERRRSGSYYTPDHIVEHIVQKTLGARCAEISSQIERQINEARDALRNASAKEEITLLQQIKDLEGSFDDRVLELKILDPAMGSGHFLIRACQYLAEEIATNPYTSDHGADELSGEESTITFWKRRVAENCLHGVDMNSMAVELAKLALWLETVAADAPLTFLDHHLLRGDSLVGSRISRLDSVPGEEGMLAGRFREELATALPALLEPLNRIAALPSETAEQVKQKETIYNRRFLPALRRFATIGDIWTSEALTAGTIRPEQYAEALGALETPRKFDEVVAAEWAQAALERLRKKQVTPFHWELAYPQVFLSSSNGQGGFDVIIGNPPYDVLSEREIGENIDHFRRFIELDQTLSSTRVGKNNLYKLFVARSTELLGNGGYLSFIVPMALLGDEQASEVRRMLLKTGEFSEIHAFPQKDIPSRRVFRDAKLSTALFVYHKIQLDARTDTGFTSQVHSAQYIEATASSLRLNSNSINLYDPANVTIVSCSQEDWSLVTTLAECPIARLGDFVSFFQGEVNQTVAAAKGVLTDHNGGPLIIRGANISMYQLRKASQGENIYLNVQGFLDGRGEDTKAFHHRFERVGLQESSPQNNFRRIISCRIPQGHFCNHKINYTTSAHCKVPLELALFVLNSSFSDWYFRLGSTNAAVSHYQLTNLPCPRFEDSSNPNPLAVDAFDELVLQERFDDVEAECLKLTASGTPRATLQDHIVKLVRLIESKEAGRGEIARTDRSHLAADAERCQIILDKLMIVLLGLDVSIYDYLKVRLGEML